MNNKKIKFSYENGVLDFHIDLDSDEKHSIKGKIEADFSEIATEVFSLLKDKIFGKKDEEDA